MQPVQTADGEAVAAQLTAIGETVLPYPSAGGRPKARRMLTELTGDQQVLHEFFGLDHWAPRS